LNVTYDVDLVVRNYAGKPQDRMYRQMSREMKTLCWFICLSDLSFSVVTAL